jgi:2-haloacid dehalogenase
MTSPVTPFRHAPIAGRPPIAPLGCGTLPAMTIAFDRFEVLSFDCYGTLIDWETGLLAAAARLLGAPVRDTPGDAILEAFARHERRLEAGPYLPYRVLLGEVARAIGADLGLAVSDAAAAAFGSSVADWPAFPDAHAALERLQARFRLAVLTNCDDDLFEASRQRLAIHFDSVVTAQQVGSYKPDKRNFEVLLERLAIPRERVLHVAQSLFHDHVPARALGFSTVWVDRRRGHPGSGATPAASAVPDLTAPDLATLADLAVGPAVSDASSGFPEPRVAR